MCISLHFKGLPGGAEGGTRSSGNLPHAGFPSADAVDVSVQLVQQGILAPDLGHAGERLDVRPDVLERRLDVGLGQHVRRGGVGRLGVLELLGEGAVVVGVPLLGQLVLDVRQVILGLLLGGLGVVALLAGRDELGRRAVGLDLDVVGAGEEDPRHGGLLPVGRSRCGQDDVERLLEVVRRRVAAGGARAELGSRLARGVDGEQLAAVAHRVQVGLELLEVGQHGLGGAGAELLLECDVDALQHVVDLLVDDVVGARGGVDVAGSNAAAVVGHGFLLRDRVCGTGN